EATSGQFDYLNTLKAPFTLAPGGYAVTLQANGEPQYIYGDCVPQWVKEQKEKSHRNINRLKKAPKSKTSPLDEVKALIKSNRKLLKKVRKNQRDLPTILSNQDKIASNQGAIISNQGKLLSNQDVIKSNQSHLLD